LIDSRKAERIPENLNKVNTIQIFEKTKQDDLGNYKFVSPPSVLDKIKPCLRHNSSNESVNEREITNANQHVFMKKGLV